MSVSGKHRPSTGMTCHLCLSGCCTILLTILATTGCGNTNAPATGKFIPPESFVVENSRWIRDEHGPTESDNQQIGRFFQSNPDMLDSPEWQGQPEKYVSGNASRQTRYYWFSGSVEIPTWNVVEFNGSQMREFAGQGLPGTK